MVEHAPEDDQVERLGEPVGQLVDRGLHELDLGIEELDQRPDAEPLGIEDVHRHHSSAPRRSSSNAVPAFVVPMSRTVRPERSDGSPATLHSHGTGLTPGVHTSGASSKRWCQTKSLRREIGGGFGVGGVMAASLATLRRGSSCRPSRPAAAIEVEVAPSAAGVGWRTPRW